MSRNLDIIKGIYAEFEKGEFDKALANVSDDIIWTERMPFAGTRIGSKDAIKAMFARVGEELEWNMQFDQFVDGGDMIVCVGTYSFRLKPFPPNEPLGTARVCHVWWFGEDGLVARYEQFADTLKGQAVIGRW
jgi:ketosteroid isomerase-like protein